MEDDFGRRLRLQGLKAAHTAAFKAVGMLYNGCSENKVFLLHGTKHFQAEIDAEILDPERGMINSDVKTALFGGPEWGIDGSDEIPIYYAAQFIWGLGISKKQWCDCFALLGRKDLRRYPICFDADLFDWMQERANAFWACVQSDTPPPPVNRDDILRMYQARGEKVIEARFDIADQIDKLRQLKARIKRLEAAAMAAESEIQLHMLDATVLTVDQYPAVTWKSQTRNVFDQERFKADQPELFSQYTKTTEPRIFLVKAIKP